MANPKSNWKYSDKKNVLDDQELHEHRSKQDKLVLHY